MESNLFPITVAHGDGIGLEIMAASLHIIEEAGNRGVKVYPQGFEETFCTDHWRADFMSEQAGGQVTHQQAVGLLDRAQQKWL